MSAEFSLLQHLGVNVDKCDIPDRVAPRPSSEKETLRVWAPTQHPPSKCGAPEKARVVLEKGRMGAHHRYADPTGEVLLGCKNGAEVQCIVYNSRVPSVYGVNKQLAERKKAEREREKSPAEVGSGLQIGRDEAKREEARRQLLLELHRCNQERARLKKEEELRERARRIAHERSFLEYNASRAIPRGEKVLQDGALRQAVAEVSPRREEDGGAGTHANVRGASTPWNSKDDDDRRRSAVAERARQLAEENLRVAEQRRVERKAQEEADRRRAQAEIAKLQWHLAEEHARDVERQRSDAEEMRSALETARERQCRGNTADSHRQASPSGSLFDEVERREREGAIRARQKLVEDMAFNVQMAAQKRESEQAERERERQYAAERARAELESFQRDVARAREKRWQERLRLQEAVEAAAKKRQKHADAARLREPSVEPLLFWPAAQSPRSEEAKKAEARRFHEDLQRQAEKKVKDRAREREAERAIDRALVEYDTRSAQETLAHKYKGAKEKAENFRRALEAQIALKRAGSEGEERPRAPMNVTHVPATQAMIRYLCPVTGRLLPASAYDFGALRGRSRQRI
ncbi:hypothetical protein JKF63_07455 [Porcisia hertigi]|uniref:Uncharacterized protein n=1 Tax=Porcisia hertigi TaxID=2761500 RepID=A0A836LEZ7_9TRYP|nr:hypothetical protein JKF63_07455 [Porcisia hertigi]